MIRMVIDFWYNCMRVDSDRMRHEPYAGALHGKLHDSAGLFTVGEGGVNRIGSCVFTVRATHWISF
jgi:hypothetical protein